MKTRILISSLVVLCLGSIICCKKEDKTKAPLPTPTALAGTYSLINVSGGLQGADVDFTKGEVQWTFDTVANSLTVNNTIDSADSRYPYSDLPSGTYAYQLQIQPTQRVLSIDGSGRGPITFTGNGWTLDDGIAVDGFLIKFEM